MHLLDVPDLTLKKTRVSGRYENHDYSTPMGGTKSPTQYSAFVYITATYIKDGSREEINIRCDVKHTDQFTGRRREIVCGD